MNYRYFIAFVLCLGLGGMCFSQDNLIQNTYSRDGFTLNGQWNYIIDMYETGYYNYRWKPHDESPNPGADAFFLNRKPIDETERIEYDFDRAPTMMIPGDWNSQEEKLLYYEGSVWFKKSFDVQNHDEAKRYFIHFGAVNYRADVYINGQKLGMHKGGFTSFNFEITDQLKAKDNFVIVRVDNKRAADEIPTLNTDWWNYGGITRDVNIYAMAPEFVQDYKVQLNPNNTREINGFVQLDGQTTTAEKIIVTIPELKIAKSFVTNSEGYATISLAADGLTKWSPTNPKLYTVIISTEKDAVEDQIGFRTITTQGSDILLNGKKIFLKGICIHEENPIRGGRAYSMDDSKMLLGWVKDLGCNYARLAHYPHNEHMVRLADQMGILLWKENPVYWTIQWENPETYKKAEQQLTELIARDKNRASVIIWSMANETPQSEARYTFLSNLAQKARALDDTRLISAALEVHSVEDKQNTMTIDDRFAEVVDVLSFNQYYGWYWGEMANIKNLRWEVDMDKPIIVSEFGAGALQGYHGSDSTIWSEEFQNTLYQETLPTLYKIPQLSGLSPWILADFRSPRRMLIPYQNGWNRKGLISETGDRKMAYYTLKAFYEGIK